ncbi:MAG: DUF4982 domain-containing protein [Cyclobacteriaceae bacterium]
MKTLAYLRTVGKVHIIIGALVILVSSCMSRQENVPREIIDFNFDWNFHLGEFSDGELSIYDSEDWEKIRLPHDWSILESYQQDGTAASTGFVPGGIGWYNKEFVLPKSDSSKSIWLEFDGVFCKSDVWINGEHLGFRPNGYSSFSYDLSPFLKFGDEPNVVLVKADHSAYADTRWYTGSGIYRNVRLIKTSPVHIPQWGVRVTTPEVSKTSATIRIDTKVDGVSDGIEIIWKVLDSKGEEVAIASAAEAVNGTYSTEITIANPSLWDTREPNLYKLVSDVKSGGESVDNVETIFGIRSIEFDSNKGFLLNGESLKIKGVNIHHDVGAIGAAATKPMWEYRVRKLKSIGVNAIRMSHNPHSVDLMEVCDEMGMLVMDEFFDEWHKPKGKSVIYLGDNAAKGDSAEGYSEYFLKWAERDLKSLISRDFNHPSVIMWSIGNEIEWTFPEYSEAYHQINPGIAGYGEVPIFEKDKVLPIAKEVLGDIDSLAIVAQQLSEWVKEEDTTRPVVAGTVRPSISLVSGFGDALDVIGFNYRQDSYDAAHAAYPDLKIIGSENWGDYSEWKAVKDRDFVSGIFAWTGFAYMGEAGPWPRKGLEISFFDFAGFKTPRGHFFETLWKDDPKVYMVTTPASISEFSFDEQGEWKFKMQKTPPPVWSELRRWEWYKVNEHWNYKKDEEIVVQVYTNCEEVELFHNGESLGRQKLTDFAEDNIIKWMIPFASGDLVAKGYNKGNLVDKYTIATSGEASKLELVIDKETLKADKYDIAHVSVNIYDAEGNIIRNVDEPVTFEVKGAGELLTVDNGWEMNVDSHYQNTVKTHNGRALAIIRSNGNKGEVEIKTSIGAIESNAMIIKAVD